MSAKKADMSAHEPSWTEVILGAVLSVALGGVLGALLLSLKPNAPVKEMPKEPITGTVYYLQGSRDSAKARQAAAKRKQFAGGASITVTEDEINSFLPTPPPLFTGKPKPKAADKAKAGEKAPAAPKAAAAAPAPGTPGAPASSGELVTLGGPNFRLHDGKVQIAVPVTIDVLGLAQTVTVVADGAFVKKGSGFVFNAETLLVGSCPLQRVPFASGYIAQKVIAGIPVPEDIAAVWPKLADVSVEGNVMKLTMP